MARFPRPVMMRMSVSPARTASSTTYWIDGLSTTGSISLGWLFVAGRKRVPSPAAGMTALFNGPSGSSARDATVRRIAIEAVLLAAHQPPQVRRVPRQHEQGQRRRDHDVAPGVPGERDRDRKGGRAHDRRHRRLAQ